MIANRDDLVATRWSARFLGRRFPIAIGRGGITEHKTEGDGATPTGIYRLTGGMWRADRRRAPVSIVPLSPSGPRDKWSDDPRHPTYNTLRRDPLEGVSHERMRRSDGLYDVVLFTDHNQAPIIPGAGSAIFVHNWKSPRRPTAGCLAFRRDHLDWILARWTPRSRIVIQP